MAGTGDGTGPAESDGTDPDATPEPDPTPEPGRPLPERSPAQRAAERREADLAAETARAQADQAREQAEQARAEAEERAAAAEAALEAAEQAHREADEAQRQAEEEARLAEEAAAAAAAVALTPQEQQRLRDASVDPRLSPEERGDTVGRTRRGAVRLIVFLVIVAGLIGIAFATRGLWPGAGTPAAAPPSPSTASPASASPTPTATPEASPTPTATPTTIPVDAGEVRQAELVAAEDERIWAAALLRPEDLAGIAADSELANTAVVFPGATVRLEDLVAAGFATRVDTATVELTHDLVVMRGGTLDLTAPGQTLRLASSPSGFTSVVAWGGEIVLGGSMDQHLRVVAWDTGAGAPDLDKTDGRAYVRANSGTLRIHDAVIEGLGFWSGRTGGVAVTGSTQSPGTAVIERTSIESGHAGIFLSSTRDVRVAGSSVSASSRYGIEINRSTGTVLDDVNVRASALSGVYVHNQTSNVSITAGSVTANGATGIEVDGRAEADGPNASGYTVLNSSGFSLAGTRVADNAGDGVSILGMSGVTISDLQVEADRTGLRIAGPLLGATVAGSTIASENGHGMRIVNAAEDVAVTESTISGRTAGLAVVNSGVDVRDNEISVGRGVALSVQGDGSSGTIAGNTLTGSGPVSVDLHGTEARIDAEDNTVADWAATSPLLDWVEENPYAVLWLLILLIPAVGVFFIVYRYRQHRALRKLIEETTVAVAAAHKREYEGLEDEEEDGVEEAVPDVDRAGIDELGYDPDGLYGDGARPEVAPSPPPAPPADVPSRVARPTRPPRAPAPAREAEPSPGAPEPATAPAGIPSRAPVPTRRPGAPPRSVPARPAASGAPGGVRRGTVPSQNRRPEAERPAAAAEGRGATPAASPAVHLHPPLDTRRPAAAAGGSRPGSSSGRRPVTPPPTLVRGTGSPRGPEPARRPDLEHSRSVSAASRRGTGQFTSLEDLAVNAVLETGRPIESVARALRLPASVVAYWVDRRFRAEEPPADES